MFATSAHSPSRPRIVILTEGHSDPIQAKTAASVIRYRREDCLALLDSTQAGATTQQLLGVGGEIPVVGSLEQVPAADTLLIGIAPSGGRIPLSWRPILRQALQRGMTIISGLHEFLSDDQELVALAHQHGAQLQDVRKNQERDVAQRRNIRSDCLRVHTVGQDCCVGKMVVSIEVARGLQQQGHDAQFVATGQTGIMIAGQGCPVDCVVSDFVNGAAEKLVLANQHHQILLIEGQGSLAHPKYSAVTLGLLHGCMPQAMILCYEAGRTAFHGMEHVPLVSLERLKPVYESMAELMHPSRIIGIAMNSRRLTAEQTERERESMEEKFQLPVCDVFRHGPDRLVQAVLQCQTELLG